MEKDRNWFERNWKWAVPSGCLTLVTLAVLFGLVIVVFVTKVMKSGPVYEEALRMATTNEQVQEKLGTPIKEGFFVTGNINVNGPSGQASIAFPISGPQGKGTVIADATKSHNVWEFNFLAVDLVSSGERVILQDNTQN